MGYQEGAMWNGKPNPAGGSYFGEPLGSANGGASMGEAVRVLQHTNEYDGDGTGAGATPHTWHNHTSGTRWWQSITWETDIDDMAGGTTFGNRCSTVRDKMYTKTLAKNQTSSNTNSKLSHNIGGCALGAHFIVMGQTFTHPGGSQPSHGYHEYYRWDDGRIKVFPKGGSGGPYVLGVKEVISNDTSVNYARREWDNHVDPDTGFGRGDYTDNDYYTWFTLPGPGWHALSLTKLGGKPYYDTHARSGPRLPPTRPEYKIVILDVGQGYYAHPDYPGTPFADVHTQATTMNYPNHDGNSFQLELAIRIGIKPGGNSYYTWPSANGYDLRSAYKVQTGTTIDTWSAWENFSERAPVPNAVNGTPYWSDWVSINHPGRDYTDHQTRRYPYPQTGDGSDSQTGVTQPTGT